MSGQEVRFTLQGDSSVAYTVTASETAGSHSFSGMLRDSDTNDHMVGGATDVTVTALAGPSAPVLQIDINAPGGTVGGCQLRRPGGGHVDIGQEVRHAARGFYTVTASSIGGVPLLLGGTDGDAAGWGSVYVGGPWRDR